MTGVLALLPTGPQVYNLPETKPFAFGVVQETGGPEVWPVHYLQLSEVHRLLVAAPESMRKAEAQILAVTALLADPDVRAAVQVITR